MKGNNSSLYLSMVLGSIGIILITFGIMEFFLIGDASNYVLLLLGFIITIHYIYFLEKKAGISKKLIWIRAIFFILILVAVYYGYY